MGHFPQKKYKRTATFSKKLLFCGNVAKNRVKNFSYFLILFRDVNIKDKSSKGLSVLLGKIAKLLKIIIDN